MKLFLVAAICLSLSLLALGDKPACDLKPEDISSDGEQREATVLIYHLYKSLNPPSLKYGPVFKRNESLTMKTGDEATLEYEDSHVWGSDRSHILKLAFNGTHLLGNMHFVNVTTFWSTKRTWSCRRVIIPYTSRLYWFLDFMDGKIAVNGLIVLQDDYLAIQISNVSPIFDKFSSDETR